MKEQVLKAMIKIVDGMTSFKTDFYQYDLKWLAKADETAPFVWVVSKSSTHLLVLDEKDMKHKVDNNEVARFQFMQRPHGDLTDIAYCTSLGGDIYYYNGKDSALVNISKDELTTVMSQVFAPICNKIYKYVEQKWSDADGNYHAKVPIVLVGDARRNIRQIFESDEADELRKTLNRFRSYRRKAKDHKIIIGTDFAHKSFTFHEVVNDKVNMNGGIIYDGGHWTIHT